MGIRLVDLTRQYQNHKQEIDRAIESVINDCAFVGNLNNPIVRRFEKRFSEYIGTEFCIACANGTDAIEILLKSMEVGQGDEVIVPSLSWIATSEAVSNVGAKPVFVDIEPDYYCINPKLIPEKITKKTKAIIPVHLYGHPADMPTIMEIARQHKLLVLEDCAQAHGADICSYKVGKFGHAASFSFFPGKNLGAFGDAGAMVTNNDSIAKKARMIAQHGQAGQKHTHKIEGRNSRMDGIQAAILTTKLQYLDDWTALRIRHATRYESLLSNSTIILPKTKNGYKHVFHLYVLRSKKRGILMESLSSKGISTTIQYPIALPFLDAYRHIGHSEADFPVAHAIQSEIMSIPMFPELKDEEIELICTTLLGAK
jgi:dTDP-4-amino-4,6-dideoxygalactose transaminase